MKTYKWEDLRELYRITNKYWKTGDVDFHALVLPKRNKLARDIGREYWVEVADLTTFVVRLHKPFNVLVEALKILGFEAEEQWKMGEEGTRYPEWRTGELNFFQNCGAKMDGENDG